MLSKQQHKENLKIFRKRTADQLKGMRIQNGLSLEQLSERSHIPLPTLRRAEEGFVYLPELHGLAKFYGRKIKIVWR